MISFIVPVKNGLTYTRALVQSVQTMNPGVDLEWVIVDSGSTDGTQVFAAEIGARLVPFRRTPFNYCAAVNLGAAAARGDLWIVANNDLEFRSAGDLSRLTTLFGDWPLLAVLSPGRPTGAAEIEFRVDGVNGACWAVRPAAFRAWDGMPEAMSGYGYDEVWTAVQCWRHRLGLAWLTGWDVFHHGSVTFGSEAGNVSPALRRNLSRLLRELGAADLDRGWNPDRPLQRLYEREMRRSPVSLALLPVGISTTLAKMLASEQGFAGARCLTHSEALPPGAACVPMTAYTPRDCQWAPWLANLLLRTEAPVVGAQGCIAIRGDGAGQLHAAWSHADRTAIDRLLAQGQTTAEAPGPPAPPRMPPVREKRPTLRQRLSALRHTWRHRAEVLPDEW